MEEIPGHGPLARQFTPWQVELLIGAAGKATAGGALSRQEAVLARRARAAVQARDEGRAPVPALPDLAARAAVLAPDAAAVTAAFKAASVVGPGLGAEAEAAGARFACLAADAARAAWPSSRPLALRLYRLAAEAAEAADYYASLDEHDASATGRIAGLLGDGIGLLRQALLELSDAGAVP